MRTVTSSTGKTEIVTVRRTEWSDSEEINDLISQAVVEVFGRISVINLLEKSNLAVTLSTSKNEVLAHASFSDHPSEDLLNQDCWENLLQGGANKEKLAPLNTLFLRLTVFNAVVDLEHICLLTPNRESLDAALLKVFEPMPVEDVEFSVYICHRIQHCPRLHIRKARVEDHDDLTKIFGEEITPLVDAYGQYFLSELIEAQDTHHHVAVCQNEEAVVGFISVREHVDLKLLDQCFELGAFDGLRKRHPEEPCSEPQEEESQESQLTKEPAGPCSKDPETDTSPNAFCIQLFTIQKMFEMRSADFLPYLFALFPDRDYCVISVPKRSPDFPLLQSFIRVVPRGSSTFPQELYLCHRWGLSRNLEVRVAVSSDLPELLSLTENLSQRHSITEDLDLFLKARKDLDGTALQAFVAVVDGRVIGLIIIRDEENIEFIRAHYDIERFMYFSQHLREEHARVSHFLLSPVLQHRTRHIFREVLRLAHRSCLHYFLYPPQCEGKSPSHPSLSMVLNFMVPVSPRRQIIYPLEELGINAPSRHITKQQASFALYHMNRKLTMEPKVTVNARIVVVGASDTSLAFLETLTFSPHLRFNNIVLISTHGLQDHSSEESTGFLSSSYSPSAQDPSQRCLRSWISVVTGKMKAIERNDKHVELMDGTRVQYDYLMLCTGLQHQLPVLACTITDQRSVNAHRHTCTAPSNLFTLNDHHDCSRAQQWILEHFLHTSGDVVVYGNSIDVFTCVETLVRLKVRGHRIHLLHPPKDDDDSSCFQDTAVECAIRLALDEQEVHTYYNFMLVELNDGQQTDTVTSASFCSDGETLRLECAAFFSFPGKTVDRDAFAAVNDACLVFDGRLVVNNSFQTNDPYIFSSGPLSKASRRCHAEFWSQSCWNSEELGQKLASVILTRCDPTIEHSDTGPDDLQENLIPLYNQAKILGGRVPGGYNYLHVSKPTAIRSNKTSASHKGREMSTGRAETGNYFYLRLSQYDVVESITCLSKYPLPVSNLLCLYGKHQLLLNRLCSRFDDELIPDFYSYFQENWCLALYHDRFTDFQQEVLQIMSSTKVELDSTSMSLPEVLEKLLDDGAESDGLRESFKKSLAPSALKKNLLDFLKYNRNHLTMYARPGLV
ncbi:hypothetical protein DNTS_035831 [Danionella cerebrum]|uniref:Uncharacterized protein n=1 Tax=Danionella cerebrum TaxID=2873325 RepID=A0A553Q3G5_9TELE|nr:hypothetical protein DNTS_035831 [Danionella translucida]